MSTAIVIGGLLGIGVPLSLATLTAIGARRRGPRLLAALLAGIFFPVTWVVWYVRDERSLRANNSSVVTRTGSRRV